jgi:hypothetical protein
MCAVILNLWEPPQSRVTVRVTLRLPVGQSVMSWCLAPSGAHDQMFVNCLTITVLSHSCAVSDERSGLSFVSHSL